jgi:hypothetical protein
MNRLAPDRFCGHPLQAKTNVPEIPDRARTDACAPPAGVAAQTRSTNVARATITLGGKSRTRTTWQPSLGA